MNGSLWAVLIALGMFIGAAAMLYGTDDLYDWAMEPKDDA